MWLGSGVALAGSYSSNSTPSLGIPYAVGMALKSQKKKKNSGGGGGGEGIPGGTIDL